jgi:hypothetical protein
LIWLGFDGSLIRLSGPLVSFLLAKSMLEYYLFAFVTMTKFQ